MVYPSGVTTAPVDPATQGGPQGPGGGLVPPPNFFHDIVVGYVSSCLWTQHNLLRIVRSLGGSDHDHDGYDHVLQPLQGGGQNL